MQTFLPYSDFKRTFSVLDYRRLGKQRVEAYQILKALNGEYAKGWLHHPAVLMWKGYEKALMQYMNDCISEWINRSYKNNMEYAEIVGDIEYPYWLGNAKFHDSHKCALLYKNFDHYSKHFKGYEPKLDYFWPVKYSALVKKY